MSRLSQRPTTPEVGRPVRHESARAHVTGGALYTDDLSQRTANALHGLARAVPARPCRVRSINPAAAVSVHHAPAPKTVLAGLPPGAAVLVLTHDHAEDLILCGAALRAQGPAGERSRQARPSLA